MNARNLSVESQLDRKGYYDRIGIDSMTPLWEVLGALVPNSPKSLAVPHQWKYAEVRDRVMEAGTLISAAEAERRVLILENPALRGQSCITQSLYAGLQLIMPGEIAPAHRCGWYSMAKALTPQLMASARRCAAVTSSSRPRGPGTTTATWAENRWSGLMA